VARRLRGGSRPVWAAAGGAHETHSSTRARDARGRDPTLERSCRGPEATPAATPYAPEVDPARFTTNIDNRTCRSCPHVFTYEGSSGGDAQRNIVTVTNDTRTVMGVACVVVHDQVFSSDTLLEDTYDWYAQDVDGNVWYFGEDSKAYEDGKVDTSGSWEGGVDGAQPGVAMEASPVVGDQYRQEYYAGEAEDMPKC